MKAATVDSFGATPAFAELPEPTTVHDGDMLLDVIAAGLHPVVRAQAGGTRYSRGRALPYVPGTDGVGRNANGQLRYFRAPRCGRRGAGGTGRGRRPPHRAPAARRRPGRRRRHDEPRDEKGSWCGDVPRRSSSSPTGSTRRWRPDGKLVEGLSLHETRDSPPGPSRCQAQMPCGVGGKPRDASVQGDPADDLRPGPQAQRLRMVAAGF